MPLRPMRGEGAPWIDLSQDERKLLQCWGSMERLRLRAKDLTDLIAPNCKHRRTEEYRWQHDNGYGSQHYVVGRRCLFCGAKDLWNRGIFHRETT